MDANAGHRCEQCGEWGAFRARWGRDGGRPVVRGWQHPECAEQAARARARAAAARTAKMQEKAGQLTLFGTTERR